MSGWAFQICASGLSALLVFPAFAAAAMATPGQAPPGSIPGIVVRVVDGDTFDVRLDGRTERVRLIGVDTPETVHPTMGVEPWGPEAGAFTRGLLPPETPVRLELDVQPRDRYGRLLAYVYLPDGRMLNALLLEQGLAQLLTLPPNVRHAHRFVKLQRQARQAGRGIWSVPPFQEPGRTGQPRRDRGGAVRIERLDLVEEVVVLVNESQSPADLSGWMLVSVTGSQRFAFPQGTTIGPGSKLSVKSGPRAAPGPGVLVWTPAYVWNNSGDRAELHNPSGEVVSRYPEVP